MPVHQNSNILLTAAQYLYSAALKESLYLHAQVVILPSTMSNPFKIRGSKDACTRRDERNLAKGDLCRTNGLQTDHERYTIVNRRRHKVDHLVGNTFKASDSLFESGWFVIDSNLSHTFYIVDQKSQLI